MIVPINTCPNQRQMRLWHLSGFVPQPDLREEVYYIVEMVLFFVSPTPFFQSESKGMILCPVARNLLP